MATKCYYATVESTTAVQMTSSLATTDVSVRRDQPYRLLTACN